VNWSDEVIDNDEANMALVSSNRVVNKTDFDYLIDSGCSVTLVNNLSLLKNVKSLSTPVKIQVAEKGAHIVATKSGILTLPTIGGNEVN
jgi:hypothetical protein